MTNFLSAPLRYEKTVSPDPLHATSYASKASKRRPCHNQTMQLFPYSADGRAWCYDHLSRIRYAIVKCKTQDVRCPPLGNPTTTDNPTSACPSNNQPPTNRYPRRIPHSRISPLLLCTSPQNPKPHPTTQIPNPISNLRTTPQNLSNSPLPILLLDEQPTRLEHVLDDLDHLLEAAGRAFGLREAREAELGAAAVLEDHIELCDEGYGFDSEVWKAGKSAGVLSMGGRGAG